MSIARNYAPETIGRPNSLVGNDNIRSPSGNTFRLVEKRILPAVKSVGKYGIKKIARAGTSTFEPIGEAIGYATGAGLSTVAGNPELAPYLGTVGGLAGGAFGEELKKKALKKIDKF